METLFETVEFNAQDRCDKCGAQAYVAYRKDGFELLFCAHHMKQHNLSLECEGWTAYYDFAALERLYSPAPPKVDA